MWIRNTTIELSTTFGSSYGILYWYTSQMKVNDVAVYMDESLLYTSLKCTAAIIPSILCIWFFQKKILDKPVATLFVLSFIGSLLGMILQLVMYTKSIISVEHQMASKPTLYVSQLFVEYWSFGGAMSGVFVASVIMYMLNILNEDQDTDRKDR